MSTHRLRQGYGGPPKLHAKAEACALLGHSIGGLGIGADHARIVPYNKDIVTLDDHVRDAIDRVLTQVREPLDGTLRELAGTIAIEARAADVRLTDALRLLDEATSFGDVLTVLADCVGREVERSAVLVVAPGHLKGWHSSGFGGAVPDAKTIELPSDPKGLLGAALSTKASIVSRASAGRIPMDDRPSFAHGTDRRDAAAVPVLLGGIVAAVVYADAPSVGDETPSWLTAVERLTRFAGLVLEARTARYLTGAPLDSLAYGGSSANRGVSGGQW